jgi:hypothetical protein
MPSFTFTDMMNNSKSRFARGVEIATNLSIIIVALAGATVLVKNYLLRAPAPYPTEIKQDRNLQALPEDSRTPRTTTPGPLQGTQLSVPGIDWAESNQTIVLALSDKCHFCTESAPFYQRLVRELTQRKDVRMVAVFPQDVNDGKKYLEKLGVPIEQVRQAPLDSLGVRGTPTLVIVDTSGVVKQSWVGRLNAERESEVLGRIKV